MSSYKALLVTVLFLGLPCSTHAETPGELIAKAEIAQQKGAYSTALIHLKNALKQEPDHLDTRLKLARLFVDTGQGVQAQVEIERARRLGAKASDTAVLAAKAKLLQGQFEELTIHVDLLDLPQSDIASLRAIQGHAFFEQRKFQQARQMFQRAQLLSAAEIEVEIGQAKLFAIEGKTDQQQKQVLALLKKYPSNADVLIVAGNFYRDSADYDRALELFEQAGLIQPSNVNVWFGVVRSHIAKRNYNDAKSEIQKVLNNYPEHQVGNYLLAVIAFEEGDFNRAKSAIDIVLKGEKRQFEALKLLSSIQFQQKEYSEAENNLKKYLAYHPQDLEAQKTLAAIYLKRKQGVLALDILKQLEKLDDAYIYSMMATAYIQLGNTEQSNAYIKRSMQSAPDDQIIQRHLQRSKLETGETLPIQFNDPDFNNFLAEGHIPILNLLRQKNYQEAERVIRGYMGTMPKNGLLHYLLGSTFLYQGNIKQAEQEFLQSIKFDSDLIESRINLAKIYLQTSRERDAEREFRKVLSLQQNNDQAMISLAGIYHRAGKEDEMLQWLNKSRNANSASLASREVLEKHYRDKGEIKKALELSAEMVSIQPQNVRLLLRHANNQKASGRIDLAIGTFDKIIELKPELASAWAGIGRLHYSSNNLSAAKFSYEKVLSLEPENLIAKVVLIQIDLRSNQLNSALEKANRMKQMHPDNAASYDMLGDVNIAMNKPDQAIKHYQESININKSTDTYLKLHTAYNRDNQIKKGFDLLQQWVLENPQNLQLKEVLALTYQRRG
ncbi:MAG: PEP-CTERM system TPR-repeat protein PrsT, partial [Gammaproteobacteria bacterium]|nr:PEP-CTERM system TPR-repeat protein PrsT [Gammaproteobacteria bacterium]